MKLEEVIERAIQILTSEGKMTHEEAIAKIDILKQDNKVTTYEQWQMRLFMGAVASQMWREQMDELSTGEQPELPKDVERIFPAEDQWIGSPNDYKYIESIKVIK